MSIEISTNYTPSGRPLSVQLFADEAAQNDAIGDLCDAIGPLTWEALCEARQAIRDAELYGTRKDADKAREQFDLILKDVRQENGEQCLVSVGHLHVPVQDTQRFAGDVVEAAGNYREAAPVTRLASVTRLHTAPGGAA